MRRFLFLPAVLGLTAALLAQSSAPSDNKPTEDAASAPCTVTGRVVSATEGNALKSARIALIPEHSGLRNQIYATTSDSDGRFTLKDIPPARYQFFATHTGFVEQHYKAGANDIGPVFSLIPGEKVSDVLFRLPAAAVITGRVSNEDGDPMQRIEVVALRRPSEEETEDDVLPRHKSQMETVASAQTDDRGQYRIFGLKPGEYYIKAADSFQPSGQVMTDDGWLLREWLGGEYGSVYYPGVTRASQAQVVPIKAGEEVQADVARHGRPTGMGYEVFRRLYIQLSLTRIPAFATGKRPECLRLQRIQKYGPGSEIPPAEGLPNRKPRVSTEELDG